MEKRTHNKRIWLILALALVLAAAAAAVIFVRLFGGTGDFRIKDDTLVRYRGSDADVVIPEGVREIDRLVFQDCDSIVSVTVPEGVEVIGEGAFASCSKLERVELPESVEEIGADAFAYDVSLESIVLPEKLAYIASETFYGCKSLQEVELGPNIVRIGDFAFYQCKSLTSVEIPPMTASVGNSAFSGCKKLQSVTLPTYNFDMGTNVFANCSSLEKIVLPENLKYINTGTFWNCKALQSIDIPEGVESIGDRAFYQCALIPECIFPEGVTYIGQEAFYGCKALRSITLPDTQYHPWALEKEKSWEEHAGQSEYVYECYLGVDCFGKCVALDNVRIPAHVTMAPSAFFACDSLKRLTVDPRHKVYEAIDGVLYSNDGENLFLYPAGLEQESFAVPEGVKYIGERAFSGADQLLHFTAGEDVETISNAAFYKCEGIEDARLNDTLEYIGQGAFEDCISLRRLEIPAACYIERNALTGCSSLAEITVDDRNRSYTSQDGVLFDYGRNTLVLYPPMKKDAKYAVPDTVETIAEYAFANNGYLQQLVLSDNLTSIQRRAFSKCTALRQVTMTDSVEAMDSEIFYGIEENVSLKIEAESETCVPILYADNLDIEYEWVEK